MRQTADNTSNGTKHNKNHVYCINKSNNKQSSIFSKQSGLRAECDIDTSRVVT